jgi:hypothetical protein
MLGMGRRQQRRADRRRIQELEYELGFEERPVSCGEFVRRIIRDAEGEGVTYVRYEPREAFEHDRRFGR